MPTASVAAVARPTASLPAAPTPAAARPREAMVRSSARMDLRDLEERFAAFVHSHQDRALRVAWRLVGGDQGAAEDVVQDALLRAYSALSRFRGESRLETWFYRILVRQAHSYRRWRSVRERWGSLVAEEPVDPYPHPASDPVLRRKVSAALESLPRTQREAFVLVHLEGFTVLEAAGIMGKAHGTVKTHLHRALQTLRVRLRGLLE
jgi:RNA polymerase sigma-70 factor (ECF subfamily)